MILRYEGRKGKMYKHNLELRSGEEYDVPDDVAEELLSLPGFSKKKQDFVKKKELLGAEEK